MKTSLLTFFSIFLTLGIYSQQKLKFNYDTAGNQVLRNRVCATCLKAVMPQVIDSLLTESIFEEPNNQDIFGIAAYPNPVTNLLFVDWETTSELKPQTVQLFTMDGRKLISLKTSSGQREQQMDFGRFPSGLYILQVVFTSGEKRSFKIIKS